jgi:hypothetical protein
MSTPSNLGDACEAHFPGDYPAVVPHDVQLTGSGSLVAFYRCWCGREWTCSWDAESAGWPTSRTEQAA